MKRLLLIILILSLSRQNFFAQTPHFRNYTVDDGLPSSHVYRAFQDSKGFIWFCTDKGIARFDGYKFEKFTTKNGLPNNDVWQCAEDSEQRIWFLSYANAFFYFDLKDNKFHVIENPYKEYHDNHVWAYIQEGKDRVRVVCSHNGNYLYINPTKTPKVSIVKYNTDKKLFIYPIEKEKVFRDGKNGFVKGNNTWTVRAFSESLQHNLLHKPHLLPNINVIDLRFWSRFISMEFDDDKTFYGSSDSISFFRGNEFISKPLNKLSYAKNDVLSLILSTGNINKKLIVTENDLFVVNENLERLKQLDFIKDFRVNTIFFDFEDNLWLCTNNQGLFLLSKKSIDSKVYELSKQSITTLAMDNLNRIWIGTNTGKIYYNEKNKIIQQHFSSEPELPIKKISCYKNVLSVNWNTQMFCIFPTAELGKNTISIQDIPLLSYNKIQFHQNSNYHKRFSWSIKALDFINENKVIIGSSNDLNTLHFSLNNVKGKKLIGYVKSLSVITVEGNNYAGTNRGLRQCNKLDVEVPMLALKEKYPILTKPISCFAEDSKHALWVGTDGYGVFRLYKNQVQQITELNGMNINYLYSEKENNRIWIATNEGVFLLKLNINILNVSYEIQKISLAQGLPTLEVNCVIVRGNELFVGTSKGLAILPIQYIINFKKDILHIPLIIKNIKINRQDTNVLNKYNLSYRQNNIDIDFVALSYKSDKNIKYDYKMVNSSNNSDTLWHPVQDLHKEFSLLSPDEYKFSLRAFDIDGNTTQPVKPVIFIINPPFWNTVWFRILAALLILSSIIFYFDLRTKNIQRKEAEKTEINKRFAELELQALQAQMNPHFVFNALSAIQNFILNNNAEEATDYLSRFSRLMRLFLESSRNKYIALSEEKTLLEYYIQLEQLRFKDKFTYQIILGEGVSLDTEIPSLLLQPFVENAINHGLVYKNTDDGYLNINFKKENNKLICIIEDNGIGRNEAAAIKNKSLKPYKSRSTEITEERLRSLELIENTKIEIDIFDKIDENFIPQGTKVTIVMYL